MGTKKERRPPLPSEPWAGPATTKGRAALLQNTNATGVERRKRSHLGQRNEESFLLGYIWKVGE